MTSDRMRAFLAVAIIALVCGILYMINMGELKDTMRDVGMIAVGGILTKFSGVYDFYFGSSDGSKSKTAMMNTRDDGPATAQEETP